MRSMAWALVAGALVSNPARAAEVKGNFSTLLAAREAVRNGESVGNIPLYGLIAFEVDSLELPGADRARIVGQGWGRWQLSDDELNDSNGDLNLLFFEGVKGPLRLRLGRQHLLAGVGRMSLIDGADAKVDVGELVSAEAFFGWDVHPELRHRTDNWQGGGRLAFNLAALDQRGELGVGYRQRRHRGELRRHELGADAVALFGPTRWAGLAVVTPDDFELIEARLAATFLAGNWSLTLDGERVVPALFLPLDSIFSVFSNSNHDAYGGDVQWSPNAYYTVTASGHALLLGDDSWGYRATLRGVTFREPSHRSLIGAEVRRVDEDENGYVRGRVFTGLQILPMIRLTGDAFIYGFDEDINGVQYSTLAYASAVYDFTQSLRVVGSIGGGSTPWAKSRIEGLVRVAYGYDVSFSQEVAP